MRIKSWEARAIQPEALGAQCEGLTKSAIREKLGRIDNDAEDECNEEVLYECLFPQCIISPGTSPMWRQTECEVRRVSCAIVPFKSVRRRVVQTRSRVMCDSGRRKVSAVEGCLLLGSRQLMMAGIEH